MATSIPASHASPELNGIVHDDEAKGVAVHSFNPDASPQEKAAVAAKSKDQIKPINTKKDNTAKG